MRNLNWERVAAGSGFAFVVLFVIAFLVPGEFPDPGDRRGEWVAYALDKTRELKISAILFGLAGMAFLWFLGSLGAALRRGGEQRLATVAFGSGVAIIAVAYVMTSLQAAIAWRLAADEPQLVRGMFDVTWGMQTLISFPAAALAYATAVGSWRARIFPVWYAAGSGILAVALAFGGAALTHDGFYAPDGAYAVITLIAFLAWTLVTSGLLMTKAQAAESAAAASVPTG